MIDCSIKQVMLKLASLWLDTCNLTFICQIMLKLKQ